MTAMLFHQSYMTLKSTSVSVCFRGISRLHSHSLFKPISYSAIVFSFILIFTDNRFSYCAIALCIVSAYWLSHMKQ